MMTSSRVVYRVESDLPTFALNDIIWDSTRQTFTLGDMRVSLTPTEFRLLYPLRSGKPVTFAQLAYELYEYEFDERIRSMIDKHIDRLRGKLKGTGIYVYCIVGYGYILLPVPPADTASLRAIQ